MRLTHEQLAGMWVEGDWSGLWMAAIPWVQLAGSSLHVEHPEDMLQEGYLAAGLEVRHWNPALSKFQAHIYARTKHRMLDYLRKSGRRPMAPLDQEEPEEGEPVGFSYQDAGYAPHGFGDPAEELARLGAPEAAEAFLRRLEPRVALRLRERWGLPTLDEGAGDPQRVADMAISQGVPRETMRDTIKNAHRAAAVPSANEYGGTGSIYPPKGRQSMGRFMTAAERHPGWWSGGVARSMGDGAAWRENLGGVWKDWSYKPTDADVLRGARR